MSGEREPEVSLRLSSMPCCEGGRRLDRVAGDATTLAGWLCELHGLTVRVPASLAAQMIPGSLAQVGGRLDAGAGAAVLQISPAGWRPPTAASDNPVAAWLVERSEQFALNRAGSAVAQILRKLAEEARVRFAAPGQQKIT